MRIDNLLMTIASETNVPSGLIHIFLLNAQNELSMNTIICPIVKD